jgi:hypothetical protein
MYENFRLAVNPVSPRPRSLPQRRNMEYAISIYGASGARVLSVTITVQTEIGHGTRNDL